MTDERQKKTTDEYRNNWDNIFKKKKTDDYQDILSTEECVLNALEECCNQECNQGRNCPRRKDATK